MTIYKHHTPERQVLDFAYSRKDAIVEQMDQLTLELSAIHRVIDQFEKTVCRHCNGLRYIMKPIEGCECDGPRQHKCDYCDGTGKPQSSEKV